MTGRFGRLRGPRIWRAAGARDFRLLWASEGISVLGDQFHAVALSWLVISLTESGLALGTVLIAISVPPGHGLVRGRPDRDAHRRQRTS